MREKEHEKFEKYQGLKEEVEKLWRVKATVVPVVIRALGEVTPKLGEQLQQLADSRNNIQDLCPEVYSRRNTKDTAQDR